MYACILFNINVTSSYKSNPKQVNASNTNGIGPNV